jgi:hypothetical protein
MEVRLSPDSGHIAVLDVQRGVQHPDLPRKRHARGAGALMAKPRHPPGPPMTL